MIPFVGFESPRVTPMAWTKTTRQQSGRDGQRYASDTTAMEWILLSELLPQRSRTGRPPKWHLRTIMDAILYILATGCQWRALPKDFPPFTTVQHYFYDWRDRNVWRKINRILVERTRRAAGRKLQALSEFGKWFIEIVTRSESTGTFGSASKEPPGRRERGAGSVYLPDLAPRSPRSAGLKIF